MGEAWVTCAISDEGVVPALVLAESLRRTRTTKRIGVITCGNVSKEKRAALRKAFDALFLMEEGFVASGAVSKEDQAKIFAFSLRLFDKCIFLAPNSLVLENADRLFEGSKLFKTLKNDKNGPVDLSFFLFSPCLDLCEQLAANVSQNGKTLSEKYVKAWTMKKHGPTVMGYFPGNAVLKFSLKTGLLSNQSARADVVQFVDASNNGAELAEQVTSLQSLNKGLREKAISEKWLEIFHHSKNSPTSFTSPYKNEPIAIIGMSCRYPGANTVEEFWNLLYQGEEGIRNPPPFRWTKEHSLKVSQQERKTNAGFLSTTVDEFDARFFGVSPKEAAFLDPQSRLLHEVMWESLEDSGIDPLSLYGTHTGIFTGSWMNDYKDIVQGSTERDFFRTYMGNSIGAAAARLSFLLGLTGPSIATESGCSSAIVAVDLAVKSLRSGESTLALAGGVNLLLHPFTSNIMDYVIAPNGRCKTFDANADGFGRAEGCGVLVLKRLSDALRDRDNICAMIRGSAVSQEGISRSLGTPTVHCEALAMELALEDAKLDPALVSYVETHGTGTAVGDPMEIKAIAKAYGCEDRSAPLVIGSVKTNVGHTESCSGITGIMKTILAFHHEIIPKHLNLETLNPEIHLDIIPATIPLEPIHWPKVQGQPRIAGVSSFGITGTDGHVIIQEAPDFELPKFTLGLKRPMHILKISGKTGDALDDLLKMYEDMFQNQKNQKNTETNDFANAAYTANVGRASFNHRACIIASNFEDALTAIQTNKFDRGEVSDGTDSKKICFLFTGQGSQYPQMAKTLYDTSPEFRVHFDECERILRETYNISIRQVLWESDPSSKQLSRTIYSQTSIFCVEYCLLKLWESWGVQPDYVLGHSLGEFAAAVAANVLNFQDALKLVAERSRLIDNLPQGSMLVIKSDKQNVEKCLKAAHIDLDFAALNNPDQTVVAGDSHKIQSFLEYLKGKGLKAIVLEASHAFHSRHMDPMLEKYRRVAETITHNEAKCMYVSGMEGRILDDSCQINADYWVRHTREKVSFIEACQALRQEGCENFLEVGPQPILSSFVMANNEDVKLNCLPSLRRGTNEWQTILTSLGKLYLQGHKVDWKGFDDSYKRNKVSLPFHPFYRKPFWVESSGMNISQIHPLVGYPMSNAAKVRIFQNDINIKSLPYLNDHRIGSRVVFPGAGYTEMCLTAGYCVASCQTDSLEKPTRAISVENFKIGAPLELKEEKNCRVQILVDLPEKTEEASTEKAFRVKVYHQNNSEEAHGKWILHASSNFSPVPQTKELMKHWQPERISELMNSVEPVSSDNFYKLVDDFGLKFGETFKGITRHWNRREGNLERDEVVAEFRVPAESNKYLLHPLIIDGMMQTGILSKLYYESARLKVPVKIDKLTLFPVAEESENRGSSDDSNCLADTAENIFYIHGWYVADVPYLFLVNKDLKPIALMESPELVDTNVKTIESVLEQQTNTFPDAWEEVWKNVPGPYSSLITLPSMASITSGEDFDAKMQAVSKDAPENADLHRHVDRLVYLCIANAFYELGWTPTVGEIMSVAKFCDTLNIIPMHTQLIHSYFTFFHDEERIMEYNSETNTWTIHRLPASHEDVKTEMERLAELLKTTRASPAASTIEYIAKSLPKILKGEESALNILFPTEESHQKYSADNFYQKYFSREDIQTKTVETFDILIQEARAKNPADKGIYRLLEVGAGTGSLTQHALHVLSTRWGDRFEYYYTDISRSFFIKAEKKFEGYKQNIKYALFNIEDNPLEQGIPLNYFDAVVCTDVIHATRVLQQSLSNIRKVLKVQGSLVFTETLLGTRDPTYVFGLLPGYWRMQDLDIRPHHCCTGVDTWIQALSRSGFQSPHVTEADFGNFGCITAEASGDIDVATLDSNLNTVPEEECKEWVIFTTRENEALHRVANILTSFENKVTILYPGSATAPSKGRNIKYVTIQPDSESSSEIHELLRSKNIQGIIYAWGMDIFQNDQKKLALPFLYIAQHLLAHEKPPKTYVLTQGVHPVSESFVRNPSGATVFGMAKSLKNENSELFIRCVDLEYSTDTEVMANEIVHELAMHKQARESHRVQIAYRDTIRYEPRFTMKNKALFSDQLKLPPSTDRYHLVLPESRLINDLDFEPMEQEEILEGEVEVKIKAFALNFKDVLTILKPSAEFEKLNTVGLDFAGVVSKVGPGVPPEILKIGDRVFGANFKETQLPSHLVLDANGILKIPDHMTYWEAATLPAVFATSIHCLRTIARMKAGETVLIHTGSGGVGLAAIQLAKHVGANIITTAGNTRKRTYLRSLGINHVFDSRSPSFGEEILKVTGGRGVDIVLNSITGPGLKEASLGTCAKNARFVEMSKLAIWSPEEVKALRPDVEYTIVDLTVLERTAWKALMDTMKQYLSKEVIKSIPYTKFDALNLKQALQYFQKAKHIGKVVCAMPDVSTEGGEFKVDVPLFNSESTYLITGGLGGIGFEVCKWMLGKGATDVVLVGRSPPKPNIHQQIEELNRKGYNITVSLGDVGDFHQCKAIIAKIVQMEKPLRGIQHSAGVLRDNMIPQQSWNSFNATFTPKITGTWNLHNLTKDMQLEHFVLFSSITALMGTPSQANHAAANCFEDTFAHYRHSLGLPAVSVNWGQWAEVGCAKDVNLSGILPVSVNRMLNGLEYTLRTQRVQSCFGEFESISVWALLCPMAKTYLDERTLTEIKDKASSSQTMQAEQFWQEMDQVEDKQEKMNVLSGYLKHMLRSSLRLDADEEINSDANIQDLGVDSLMLIELKNSIQTLVGSRLEVSAALLKNCSTITELSNAIVSRMLREDDEAEAPTLTPEELTTLLNNDCILDEEIKPIGNMTKPSAMKTLLVTGSTGQLGPYILTELCKSYKSIEKIVCLIRARDGITPESKLEKILTAMNLLTAVDFSKFHCVRGDVGKPNFGMKKEEYEELCESVDGIIHCAVKSNHVELYNNCTEGNQMNLRSVNVGGTINVLKFAATKRLKHVYYASAYTNIFGGNDEGTLPDHWPELNEIKIIVDNNIPGYQASKFVCEQLMQQANSRGLPCKVFRFPWITGTSQTGQLNYENNHYILRFLSYLKLRAIPSIVLPAIVLPVDTCAKLSLRLFMNDDAPHEIFNIGHPNPQLEQEFIPLAKEEFGVDLEIVEYHEFAAKIASSDSPLGLLKELYTDVDRVMNLATSDAVRSLQGYINSPDTFFVNKKVLKYIPEYGENIDSSMNIIMKNLNYVKSTGFFKKFKL